MTDSDSLVVDDRLAIPRSELHFRASRAGGAGGQHVNTSSTRIELLWDLEGSAAVDDEQRARIRNRLVGRLDREGMVRVVASNQRSQLQNRAAAEKRLAMLLRSALAVPKPRKTTAPSRAAVQRRLDEKRRRAEKKRERGKRPPDE